MYTDSHCHITCDRLYSRIDEIIENIKAKNLTSCMIMCTSPEELERAKKVKEKYPFFKIAFGWFPSDAKEVADKEIQYLIAVFFEPCGIGGDLCQLHFHSAPGGCL